MLPGHAIYLAEKLIDHFLPNQEWKIELDNHKRRLGACNSFTKTIFISRFLILGTEDVKVVADTILHEIAHALVGPNVKSHGWEWQQRAKQIGCSGQACGNLELPEWAKPTVYAVCIKCQWESKPRFRFPTVGKIYVCPKCRRQGKKSVVDWEKR